METLPNTACDAVLLSISKWLWSRPGYPGAVSEKSAQVEILQALMNHKYLGINSEKSTVGDKCRISCISIRSLVRLTWLSLVRIYFKTLKRGPKRTQRLIVKATHQTERTLLTGTSAGIHYSGPQAHHQLTLFSHALPRCSLSTHPH